MSILQKCGHHDNGNSDEEEEDNKDMDKDRGLLTI